MPQRRPRKTEPLEQEIEAALQPGHFISDRASWHFVERLERVEDKIARLVPSAPPRAVALYETYLAGCYEKAEEIDDSGGEFGLFVDRLFLGWVKARQAAGSDPAETARRLVGWMEDDAYGYCHQLERDLVKVLDKPGLVAFERCIHEQFDRVATAVLGPGERQRDPPHQKKRAAEILRVILAAQRNVEAFIALCEATELSPADCLALAKMLQARRKPVDALAWVERGLALERKGPSSSADYELGNLKRSLLLKLGRGDAALDAAWTDFKVHPSKVSYADLMRCTPKADRAAWHQKAMDAAGEADLRSAIEFWLETKEFDRLIERLRRARDEDFEGIGPYTTESVAKKLAKAQPEVAARMYRALGMRFLKAKKSKHYEAALSSFEAARRCYERAGLSKKWKDLVRELRAEHHRETGFMSSFEEVVAGGRPSKQPRSAGG